MSSIHSLILVSKQQLLKWGDVTGDLLRFSLPLPWDILLFSWDIELWVIHHEILSFVPICTTYSRNYPILSAVWTDSFPNFKDWYRLLVFAYLYNALVVSVVYGKKRWKESIGCLSSLSHSLRTIVPNSFYESRKKIL